MRRLTLKEALFVVRKLEGDSDRRAYEGAGYSCRGTPQTVQKRANELAKRPHVAELIAWKLRKKMAQAEITQERILTELAASAFTRLTDVVVLENGKFSVRDFSSLSGESQAALKSVKVKVLAVEDGQEVLQIEVTMCDKLKALDLLMATKGMKRGEPTQLPVMVVWE